MPPSKFSSTEIFQLRHKVFQLIRQFFDEQGFTEITPHVLQTTVPLEPNIEPFSTIWKTPNFEQTLFLATSPERSLKLALAAGLSNAYAFGHVSRNLEGTSLKHQPEFMMLEWYRSHAEFPQIIKDVQALILFLSSHFEQKFPSSWPELSLIDLFAKHVSKPLPELLSDEAMIKFCNSLQYETANSTWSQLFDQVFLNFIETKLPKTPFFLVDFPARISPLCTPQPNNPNFAQRFELYINGHEIANGNTEQTDASLVRAHFEEQHHLRSEIPIDEPFLQALSQMKDFPYAGIGLGVDRLIMMLTGISDIRRLHSLQ
jgi:elongation factor P--(R)-beta-lysine ligase